MLSQSESPPDVNKQCSMIGATYIKECHSRPPQEADTGQVTASPQPAGCPSLSRSRQPRLTLSPKTVPLTPAACPSPPLSSCMRRPGPTRAESAAPHDAGRSGVGGLRVASRARGSGRMLTDHHRRGLTHLLPAPPVRSVPLAPSSSGVLGYASGLRQHSKGLESTRP